MRFKVNKKGADFNITTLLIVGLLVVGGYYLYTSMQPSPTPQNLIPSDLKTTITLNTKDALAITPTNAGVNYYVFKDSGEFYKEGTTQSGTTSFDVQYGGNYKLIAYNDTSADSGVGYLPEQTSFLADSGEGSVKTINMKLYKVGGMSISSARDPIDLDANITCGTGSTVDWQVLFKENVSNAAVLNPVLVIDANATGIDSAGITVGSSGWSKVDCPSRLSGFATTRKLTCFAYSGVVTSAMGIQTIDGSVKYSNAISPGCSKDNIIMFTMIDQQMYAEPDYVTAGYSAFKIGTQDTQDTDVGSVDSLPKNVSLGG